MSFYISSDRNKSQYLGLFQHCLLGFYSVGLTVGANWSVPLTACLEDRIMLGSRYFICCISFAVNK